MVRRISPQKVYAGGITEDYCELVALMLPSAVVVGKDATKPAFATIVELRQRVRLERKDFAKKSSSPLTRKAVGDGLAGIFQRGTADLKIKLLGGMLIELPTRFSLVQFLLGNTI